MSPKILLEKNKERENGVSEEKERRRSKKKSNGCTSSFYVDFCLRGGLYFGCNVIQKSSSDDCTLVPNRNLILKGYILKSNG